MELQAKVARLDTESYIWHGFAWSKTVWAAKSTSDLTFEHSNLGSFHVWMDIWSRADVWSDRPKLVGVFIAIETFLKTLYKNKTKNKTFLVLSPWTDFGLECEIRVEKVLKKEVQKSTHFSKIGRFLYY